MSWKVIIWFIVYHILSIFSENPNNPYWPKQNQIRDDALQKLHFQALAFWNSTLPGGNIRFVPLALQTSHHILELRDYFEDITVKTPNSFYTLLERGTDFARIVVNALENETSVQVIFKNVILYDQRFTNELYLCYVKNLYHAETHEMSFDFDNAAGVNTFFSEWMYKVIKRRQPALGNPWKNWMANLQTTVLTFTGCWDTPKISHRRRFRRALDGLLSFKTWNSNVMLLPFTATERIGYYNNPELEYEVIRIPFKNDQFAMAIVLPYQNNSLELLKNFKVTDYLDLFNRVNEKRELIEYTLPLMNSSLIVMNHNGSSINGNETFICDWSSVPAALETNAKKFYVDRPFGAFIYEENTKYVLSYVLVRDPSTGLHNYLEFSGKVKPRVKLSYPITSMTSIPSYVVFY